jgi:hypothetical protein
MYNDALPRYARGVLKRKHANNDEQIAESLNFLKHVAEFAVAKTFDSQEVRMPFAIITSY